MYNQVLCRDAVRFVFWAQISEFCSELYIKITWFEMIFSSRMSFCPAFLNDSIHFVWWNLGQSVFRFYFSDFIFSESFCFSINRVIFCFIWWVPFWFILFFSHNASRVNRYDKGHTFIFYVICMLALLAG